MRAKFDTGDRTDMVGNEGGVLMVYNPLIYSVFFKHVLSNTGE